MKLRMEIDLSKLPQYETATNELAVIFRELADWIEQRQDSYTVPTGIPKTLRNFESEVCGHVRID